MAGPALVESRSAAFDMERDLGDNLPAADRWQTEPCLWETKERALDAPVFGKQRFRDEDRRSPEPTQMAIPQGRVGSLIEGCDIHTEDPGSTRSPKVDDKPAGWMAEQARGR